MRAELQRRELAGALDHMRSGSLVSASAGRLALGLVRTLIGTTPGASPMKPKPWMLSAGLILVRALRASPTARWIAGAAAVGGAVWWVARALRSETPDDESG
jgi:hypothetical protein